MEDIARLIAAGKSPSGWEFHATLLLNIINRMKNQFSFRLFLAFFIGQFQFGSRATRAAILTLMLMAAAFNAIGRPAIADTCEAPWAQASGYTFYASATLATPFNGSVSINIMPAFEDYVGFENAQMEAVLSGNGATLYVTINNVSTNILPLNAFLGTITISDGDQEVTFTVATDGGGGVFIEDNI